MKLGLLGQLVVTVVTKQKDDGADVSLYVSFTVTARTIATTAPPECLADSSSQSREP